MKSSGVLGALIDLVMDTPPPPPPPPPPAKTARVAPKEKEAKIKSPRVGKDGSSSRAESKKQKAHPGRDILITVLSVYVFYWF